MNKNTRLSLSLAALLITLVGVGGYLTFANKSRLSESLGQISQTDSVNSNIELKLEQKPVYVVRDFISAGKFDTQIYDTANKKIFVSSTLRLCGVALDEFVFSENAKTLYLKLFNPGTDLPITEIYSLNTENLDCKRLAISDNLRDFGAKILSPDRTRLAIVLEGEPRLLQIADLAKDSVKTELTLRSGQTLNGGFGGLSNHFEIRWADDKTIVYTVYMETETTDPATGLKPVIEERTLRLK